MHRLSESTYTNPGLSAQALPSGGLWALVCGHPRPGGQWPGQTQGRGLAQRSVCEPTAGCWAEAGPGADRLGEQEVSESEDREDNTAASYIRDSLSCEDMIGITVPATATDRGWS